MIQVCTHCPKTSHQENPAEPTHPYSSESLPFNNKFYIQHEIELYKHILNIIQNLCFDDFQNLNYLPGATGQGNNGLATEAVAAKLKIVNMTNFMFLSCFTISVG